MADSGITVQTPSGNVTVATDEFPGGTHHERTKVQFGATGSATDVSSAAPLPVSDASLATALASLLTELGQKLEASDIAGLATASKQDSLLTELSQKLEPADLASLATAAKQDTLKTAVDAVTAKLTSDPATGTAQTTAAGKLDAIKTSTDAVTTKLTSDPSTATKQDAVKASVDTLHTDNGGPGSSPAAIPGGGSGLLGFLRHIRDLLAGTLTVSGAVTIATAADVATTLTDGRKTVAAAGTAEAIRASLACKWVVVTALLTNTAQVNVGGSGASSVVGSTAGTPLRAGASITIPVSNANLVFVDARVTGEGVSFTVGS